MNDLQRAKLDAWTTPCLEPFGRQVRRRRFRGRSIDGGAGRDDKNSNKLCGKTHIHPLRCIYAYSFASLFIASFTLSGVANAVRRTYPSPAGPKPAPGVQTTLALLKSRSKNSHEPTPLGVCTQM